MEKVKIRPARLEDAAALKVLTKVLGYEITVADLQENLQEILEHPGLHFLYLAENSNQEIIGYIEGYVYSSLIIAQEIRIMGVAVLEAYQDQGIGGQLLDYLENEARTHGFQRINLGSGEKRHLAHDFYRKHGYEEDHKQVKFIKKIS